MIYLFNLTKMKIYTSFTDMELKEILSSKDALEKFKQKLKDKLKSKAAMVRKQIKFLNTN